MVQVPHTVVLIVDDDYSVLKLVEMQLRDEGIRAVTASTGAEAILKAEEVRPDLLVLDLALPDMSGFEVMNRIRERVAMPTIMLTGRSGDSDKIRGLEMGADDYLSKPFNPEELTARIRAVLRRTHQQGDAAVNATIEIGDLAIDLDRRTVRGDGELIPLTRTEWRLLEVLVRNRGKVLLNPEILGKVWGPEYVDDLQYLRVWVSRLRKKLQPDRDAEPFIQTFPGMGYMFQESLNSAEVEEEDSGGIIP